MRSLFAGHLLVSVIAAAHSSKFWCPETADGLCDTSGEDVFSEGDMSDFVRNVSFSSRLGLSSGTVDSSTIHNKVLAGYQGWAIAGSRWKHWSKDGKVPDPAKKNEHFEMVPQVSEYPPNSLHDTRFKHNGDGSVVKLYENSKEGVVDLHFKWMKDYGMDGVLLQRFISHHHELGSEAQSHGDTVLKHMDAAAAKHGRVYAMMWDMSSGGSHWDQDLKSDWKANVKQYTKSRQYLKEGGKPVIAIYGIGLSSRAQAKPSQSLSLIRWLQAEGLYVIGSGPYHWRTGGGDAASGFDEVHKAFDAIMPWAVGRYNSVSRFNRQRSLIAADASMTSGRGQGYAPVAFAGYSYRDTNKINQIPRNAGLFFQAQIDSHLQTSGATFYYIAMFDEVQEGTAIYKFASNLKESAKGRTFVTADIDGTACPGDHYLTMAGLYAARAKGGSAAVTV